MSDQGGAGDATGLAAIQDVVDRVKAGSLSKAEALLAVTERDIEEVLHAQFDGGPIDGTAMVASGLGASPGAAVGAAYFSPDAAVDAYDAGADVILVMNETSPEDVHGMAIAEGILTTRGGMASHAAVVARGWGKPAVCGADSITIDGASFTVGGVTVNEGDVVSIDGASGEVYVGAVSTQQSDGIPDSLAVLLTWADEVRGDVIGVRANADTPADAAKALEFGAEGIGLCRTEHQFLGERTPYIRRVIFANIGNDDGSADTSVEADALDHLAELQEQDFLELLEVMDDMPVTIRLLDPPLHEFLPELEDLLTEAAAGDLEPERAELLEAAKRTRERNPMLGTRGVRLGILRNGLFHMQVRALLSAAHQRQADGGHPRVEIMVPLVAVRPELELVRGWIDDEIEAAGADLDSPLDFTVGTMVETPRAALCAADIADAADFFSFGTNDLTQMTFGFSRDDVEAVIVPEYQRLGLLEANPFETLDVAGVGALVASATEAGRRARPDLKVGVCGEHGGDPASIAFFVDAGLDYVSCSPFRLPVARLAVAQAMLCSDATP